MESDPADLSVVGDDLNSSGFSREDVTIRTTKQLKAHSNSNSE